MRFLFFAAAVTTHNLLRNINYFGCLELFLARHSRLITNLAFLLYYTLILSDEQIVNKSRVSSLVEVRKFVFVVFILTCVVERRLTNPIYISSLFFNIPVELSRFILPLSLESRAKDHMGLSGRQLSTIHRRGRLNNTVPFIQAFPSYHEQKFIHL
jgi:hypothetical protein